jgi:hypothetical protein
VKPQTVREMNDAVFGTKGIGERRLTGRFVLEKWLTNPEGFGGRWVAMSVGDPDRNARPGHELDHFLKQAKALEGKTRLRNTKSGEVVWPPESQQ